MSQVLCREMMKGSILPGREMRSLKVFGFGVIELYARDGGCLVGLCPETGSQSLVAASATRCAVMVRFTPRQIASLVRRHHSMLVGLGRSPVSDGHTKSMRRMASDGFRLYFTEMVGGHSSLAAVSGRGGEIVPIPDAIQGRYSPQRFSRWLGNSPR